MFMYRDSIMLCYHVVLHNCLHLVKLRLCILTLFVTQPTLFSSVFLSTHASCRTFTLGLIAGKTSPHPIDLPIVSVVCPCEEYNYICLRPYLSQTHIVCLCNRDPTVFQLLKCLVGLLGYNTPPMCSLVPFFIAYTVFLLLIF